MRGIVHCAPPGIVLKSAARSSPRALCFANTRRRGSKSRPGRRVLRFWPCGRGTWKPSASSSSRKRNARLQPGVELDCKAPQRYTSRYCRRPRQNTQLRFTFTIQLPAPPGEENSMNFNVTRSGRGDVSSPHIWGGYNTTLDSNRRSHFGRGFLPKAGCFVPAAVKTAENLGSGNRLLGARARRGNMRRGRDLPVKARTAEAVHPSSWAKGGGGDPNSGANRGPAVHSPCVDLYQGVTMCSYGGEQ